MDARTAVSRVGLIPFILLLGACSEEEPRPTAPERRETPEIAELKHRFSRDRELRYKSTTVERETEETTIEMRSRWKTVEILDDGSAEVRVTIEHYEQDRFPRLEAPDADTKLLNTKLVGAEFRLKISRNGHEVEHLGRERVPALSEFAIKGIETALRGHVLRLPEGQLFVGRRWTVNTPPSADEGPGSVSQRSQWRVLSRRERGGRDLLELVCLSTFEPRGLKVEGRTVRNRTQFHYTYQWDIEKGVLRSLTSKGSSTTVAEAPIKGEEPSTSRRTFEGRLVLLDGEQ